MAEGHESADDLGQEKFGARLKRLREDRGLSIARLAQRSGITQGYLSQIEAGKRPTPGIGTLIALASAFRITLDELTGFDLEAIPEEPESAGTAGRLDKLEQLTLRLATDMKKGFEEIRKRLPASAEPQSSAAEHRRPRGRDKR